MAEEIETGSAANGSGAPASAGASGGTSTGVSGGGTSGASGGAQTEPLQTPPPPSPHPSVQAPQQPTPLPPQPLQSTPIQPQAKTPPIGGPAVGPGVGTGVGTGGSPLAAKPKTSSPENGSPNADSDTHDEPVRAGAFRSTDEQQPQQAYTLLPHIENFRDPTRPLSYASGPPLSFADGVVERWAARLTSGEPLLILCCTDQTVAHAAVHHLSRLLPDYEARELMFGPYALTNVPIDRAVFAHPAFGGGRKAVIYAFADMPDGNEFLSLLPIASYYYARWALTLREERRLVVVTTPERLEQTRIAQFRDPNYVESVDFVSPRIRARFGEERQDIVDEVKRQHARGLWGGEAKLLEWLRDVDRQAFETGYAQRQRLMMDEADAATALTRERDEQLAAGLVLLDDATPIEAAVLFTCAYFPRLRVADFLALVTALLGDDRADTIVDGLADRGIGGAPRLVDLWKRGMRGYLRTCGVRTDPAPPPRMDFASPDVRDGVQARFESQDIVYHEQLCARVDAAGLIAHESPEVRAGAIALAARRMIADPTGYGVTGLAQLIGPLLPSAAARVASHNGSSADASGVASSGSSSIAAAPPAAARHAGDPLAFAQLPAAERRRIVTALHELFTQLLDKGALDIVVRQVQTMLEHHRHEELLWLLPRISHAAFAQDRFRSYRRLIDEGNEETRREASETLLRTLALGGTRAAPLLQVLRTWADGSAAPHAARATALLRDLLIGTMAAPRQLQPHPLASALAGLPDDQADAVLAWIATLTSDDLLEELQEIPNGKLLCLGYLWILPRPQPARAFDPDSGVWPFIQGAWLANIDRGVRSMLGDTCEQPFDDMFAALALADAAIALSADAAGIDPTMRDARLASIARVVLALPPRRLRALRLHWRAIEQAIAACLIVLPDTTAAADATLRHQLRDRWRGMRDALKALFAATAPPPREDARRDCE